MTLRLYNTMTRTVDAFVPLNAPAVSLYTCGPTVYNYAHIGNFRTFVFEDVLRRWLEASGYDVFHVMNLTDVDDKTIKGALANHTSLHAHVEPFIAAFHEDRAYLKMLDAAHYPRATEFIPAMIALVNDLLARGVAYRGDDGSVYFAIARFPAYGKLSRLDTRELKAGASGRVSDDEYAKEDARDFVLWKAARPEDEEAGAAWDAPFGRGRPGWHLECSAMALDLLKEHSQQDVLDIHAGGIDLIFPHHEDEIAQSCAHTGETDFARVWMHGEFLTMAGTKMSKRFGNILTARDLRLDGIDAAAVRLLFATTHYRQKLDFTDEALVSAKEGSRRLGEFGARMLQAPMAEQGVFDQVALVLKDEFSAAMNDDLNTPRALAALFEATRAGNRALDAGERPTQAFRDIWHAMIGVLQVEPVHVHAQGLDMSSGPDGVELQWTEGYPSDALMQAGWAKHWAAQRTDAKAQRNFAESDRIRALLLQHGWEVRDGRDGTATVQRR
ncbi:MAG TPA: cysteine--tRNA ligase [Gemmatimonadales bacterium]|nr:cysteine--tRNA ligase [Gemmatimonadales bacterium]